MITLISATNRPNSSTAIITNFCYSYLRDFQGCQILDLVDLPYGILHTKMYEKEGLHSKLAAIQDQFIVDPPHWVIISPEYNGSFPGILKLFFDAISIRKYKESFKGKKVALIGVSSGRAGNLRGMEHLTSLLNYLNVTIYPDKLPISNIHNHIDADQNVSKESQAVLSQFLDDFVAWAAN